MKKSKPQSKRGVRNSDPQIICEVQSVLRGRIFHADVPPQMHGLEGQKRLVLLHARLNEKVFHPLRDRHQAFLSFSEQGVTRSCPKVRTIWRKQFCFTDWSKR